MTHLINLINFILITGKENGHDKSNKNSKGKQKKTNVNKGKSLKNKQERKTLAVSLLSNRPTDESDSSEEADDSN